MQTLRWIGLGQLRNLLPLSRKKTKECSGLPQNRLVGWEWEEVNSCTVYDRMVKNTQFDRETGRVRLKETT